MCGRNAIPLQIPTKKCLKGKNDWSNKSGTITNFQFFTPLRTEPKTVQIRLKWAWLPSLTSLELLTCSWAGGVFFAHPGTGSWT
jgi:hypothetical protein